MSKPLDGGFSQRWIRFDGKDVIESSNQMTREESRSCANLRDPCAPLEMGGFEDGWNGFKRVIATGCDEWRREISPLIHHFHNRRIPYRIYQSSY